SRPSPTVASTSVEDQNNDTSTFEETALTNPSKPFIKFVKPKDSQPESKIEEQETPKKPQFKNSEQNRPAGHRPHVPSMNPRRPTMNGARPYKTFFQTSSFETRPFLKSSAVNNSYKAPWVPTVN
nr:hypothetical protein [Tanacetum cinerariifolium]